MLTVIVYFMLTRNVNVVFLIIITIYKRFVDQYGSHVSIPRIQRICKDEGNKDVLKNIANLVSLENRDYCQNTVCFIIAVFKEGVYP